MKYKKTHGVRQCALQGLEIMQVEILPGKELTNPPEVSFELLLVTAVAKFRSVISKHPVANVVLIPLDSDVQQLLDDFNRMRNWQNHVPESLLVVEMEHVKAGTMVFPMDPVEIIKYRTVTYAYFEAMIEINKSFYKAARKIIQAAKKDYSSIYGKSVLYSRVYTDSPLDFDKSIPTKQSAKIQGIKGNLLD